MCESYKKSVELSFFPFELSKCSSNDSVWLEAASFNVGCTDKINYWYCMCLDE